MSYGCPLYAVQITFFGHDMPDIQISEKRETLPLDHCRIFGSKISCSLVCTKSKIWSSDSGTHRSHAVFTSISDKSHSGTDSLLEHFKMSLRCCSTVNLVHFHCGQQRRKLSLYYGLSVYTFDGKQYPMRSVVRMD